MAQNRWAPKSIFRKQKVRVTVSGTIVDEVFTISIGGLVMATYTAPGAATAIQVCAGLYANWNVVTETNYGHPYRTMTITDNLNGTLDFEAITAGCPYTLTLNTPGDLAVFTQATVYSNLSPNDVSIVGNWSLGALPTTAGDIKIGAGTPDMLWGLDAITDTADDWEFEVGGPLIGLPAETFQVTPTQVDRTVPEYRATHLGCKGSDHRIGLPVSLGQQANWPVRLKLDTGNVASNIVNRSTARQTGEHPPVQLKTNSATTVIHNYGADIGIGEDVWGDTSTFGSAYNYEPFSRMRIGFNVTFANAEFDDGSKGILGSYPTTLLRLARGAYVDPQALGTIALVRGPGTLERKTVTVTVTAAY